MPAKKKRSVRIANPVDHRRWTSVKRAIEYVRQGRARCLPDGTLEFITADHRHASVVANAAGTTGPCRPIQQPTIDPIRNILPGEIVEWINDLTGGLARYPLADQSSCGPGLFAREGAGL